MAAAIVDGLLGVAAEGSERFMRSKQPDGVYATGTTARHLGILSEVNWTFFHRHLIITKFSIVHGPTVHLMSRIRMIGSLASVGMQGTSTRRR